MAKRKEVSEETKKLRVRFTQWIMNNWTQNHHSLQDIPCVYALVAVHYMKKFCEIEYIGSTTKLFSRYKSHKIPEMIQKNEWTFSIMYFLPMEKGFYDYERKLIRSLLPKYNKITYGS